MRLLGTAAGRRGILVLVLALVLAALLNAEGLRKQAQIQPQGFERRVALAATRPLVHGQPRAAPDDAAARAPGRDRPRRRGRIDTRVHLTLPPPAGPLPAAAPISPDKPAASRRSRSSRGATRCGSGSPATRSRRCPATRSSGWAATRRRASASRAVSSTGLARPDLYNWYTRFTRRCSQVRGRRSPSSRSAPTTPTTTWRACPAERRSARSAVRVVDRRVPPTRRRRDPRARTPPASRRVARTPDPRRSRLQAQLPDRQRDHRRPSRGAPAAARRTSTRGTCSTVRAARTRRTCAYTGP